jgi:hypothetical protein
VFAHAERAGRPNKEMKLTSVERFGRSQLISGVRHRSRRDRADQGI